jgi:two-component system sensor histidine kinase/response regulator
MPIRRPRRIFLCRSSVNRRPSSAVPNLLQEALRWGPPLSPCRVTRGWRLPTETGEQLERMRGDVGIDAVAGNATTCCFSLWLQPGSGRPPVETPPLEPHATRETADHGRTAMRLLIVDDERTNRNLILAMLASIDLQADCARSGEEAVTLAASERYALILMDLQLPAIDGMEATRRIRQLPHCASVPIIALSGRSDDDVADACQQAGMNDFVAKPFSLGVLLDTVTRWLRSSPPA